jgi:hypothetical protein
VAASCHPRYTSPRVGAAGPTPSVGGGGGALEEAETARARWERETVEAGWCLAGTASGGAGDLGKERKKGRGQAHAIGAVGAELSSPWRER